jgi:hypothetical protein
MSDDVRPLGLAALPPEALGDIWSDITAKVTGKAVDSINKVIKDQFGDIGGAILGPVVTKGMSALVGALGLDTGKSDDMDKVMAELAKIKDTLAQMQGELRKIENAVKVVGDLVLQESERINQAAKYRDYLAARESIDAMWTTVWSLLIGVASHPEDREAVASARSLYTSQTVNFIRDTLTATASLKNAVLKMFGDRESLFLYMSKYSQPLDREAILREVAATINTDGMTLLKKKRPAVWEAMLAGPCGDVLRDMKSYHGSGLDGRTGALTRFWYGESWFIFMEAAHAAIAKQIGASPLTVFLGEINMAFSRALIILTIIYGRNTGLTTAVNKVIENLDEIATEGNLRYSEFTTSLISWIGSYGTWGTGKFVKRPTADRRQLFGMWAAQWMDTTTELMFPCSYATDAQGQTYPCTLFSNFPDVKTVAEKIWRDPNAMNFVYEKKGPNQFGYRYTNFAQLGPSLETWAKQNAQGRLPMVQTYPKLPAV